MGAGGGCCAGHVGWAVSCTGVQVCGYAGMRYEAGEGEEGEKRG